MTASYWGVLARAHWQRHLPRRLAALEDPDGFFADLEDEAQAYHAAIRDGLLDPAEASDLTRIDPLLPVSVVRQWYGNSRVADTGRDDSLVRLTWAFRPSRIPLVPRSPASHADYRARASRPAAVERGT